MMKRLGCALFLMIFSTLVCATTTRTPVIKIEKHIDGVHFVVPVDLVFQDFANPTIKRKYYSMLLHVAKLLKKHPKREIAVKAHTDNLLPPARAKALSLHFAKEVSDFLVESGIDADRITVLAGNGSLEPAESNSTSSGRAHNRRVDIILLENA